MPEPTTAYGDPNCEHRWSGPLDKHPTCLDCSFAYVAPVVPEPTRYSGHHGYMCSRHLHAAKPQRFADLCDCGIEAWGARLSAEARRAVLTTLRERVVGLIDDHHRATMDMFACEGSSAYADVLDEIDRLMAEDKPEEKR